MKKILWLSGTEFSDIAITGVASWLQPMAEGLQKQENIQIINVTTGNVNTTLRRDYNDIIQFIIPNKTIKKNNYHTAQKTCKQIFDIVQNINPDLVHIWGTEHIWASIYEQGYINKPTLIDIQGLLFRYTDYYYGGLGLKDILNTISLKEILMPWRTLLGKKNEFYRRGRVEINCLKTFQNISYQSDWVLNNVRNLNCKANYFSTKILLRKAFYSEQSWEYKEIKNPIVFSSASAAVPYKGLHVLVKSISLLKEKYPNIQLRLAGKIDVGNKLLDGYSIYLKKLIRRYNLENNVVYVGSLNDHQIKKELLNCNVCVIPSFVETYCLAFAEAMILGVPTVASFTSALPELAENGKEALFYYPNDEVTCASHIDKLLVNKELSTMLSVNARERRLIENNPKTVVNRQIEIYNKILQIINQ